MIRLICANLWNADRQNRLVLADKQFR